MGEEIKLTILMPCLNEEKTIKSSIELAKEYIDNSKINAEILISDNGSTDNSVKLALDLGARVIFVGEKGYGNALRNGIKEARGKYIIMGDSDATYDFSNLQGFIDKLDEGYTLVIGNRYRGGIEKGAMPFLHRYIGIPFLSWLGKRKYKVKIEDFHCGLRGFHTKTAQDLNFETTGMEFATEIIHKFAKNREKIIEIPAILKKDVTGRIPHLNTIRDGLRHLKYILKY